MPDEIDDQIGRVKLAAMGLAIDQLTQEQKDRYGSVYCGICRDIGRDCSQPARLGLRYDMAFLALTLLLLALGAAMG